MHKIARGWTDPGKVILCCLVVLIWLYKLRKERWLVNHLNPELSVNNFEGLDLYLP